MSAKASEKSSARNVSPPMHPSRSNSSATSQRPPFIHSVFLLLVHAPSVPRILGDANFSALGTFQILQGNPALTYNVDSIAHRGVTTAVMLTPSLRRSIDQADGLSSHMYETAQRNASFDAHTIRVHLAEDIPNIFRNPDLSEIRGIHLIRTVDLTTADRVVAHLNTVLSPLQCVDRQTSAAAIGILLTGDGNWSQLVRLPTCYDSGLVHRPRQSYQIGVDETPALGGLMCLAGNGIVRTDSRECLSRCYGPGDGCLRPDQIVLEMLSKTELICKFGA